MRKRPDFILFHKSQIDSPYFLSIPSIDPQSEPVDMIEREILRKQAGIVDFEDILTFWDDYDPRTGKITTQKKIEDDENLG